jgi:hypothetical protein
MYFQPYLIVRVPCSFWVLIKFSIILFLLGSKQALEANDVYPLPTFLECSKTYAAFSLLWKKELETKGPEKSNVAYVLFDCYRKDFIYATWSIIPYGIMTLAQPFLVKGVLNYIAFRDAKLYGMHNGYLVVCLLLISSAITSLGFSNSFFWLNQFAFKFRSSIMAVIYTKSMRLSSTARYLHKMAYHSID